ncbi:MAG TPA: TetR/AcrR family transcriptional regulator [Terriglobales bacterium]|nr:TetR/AcrR family transcriptional regulator [Terriglobales bacterium]
MPKLLDNTFAKNKLKIEEAALRLFTRKGFHGTTVREIAEKAGVSMGKLYIYYDTKEEIFIDLVQRLGQKIEALRQKELIPLLMSLDPSSMKKLAMTIGRIVSENLDYWRLMYIDVVEFRHKHFIHSFREIAGGLRTYSRVLAQTTKMEFPKGVDPAVAVTTIYLHFFTYFLVENLFGAKRHLGMSDEEAIDQMIRLYLSGLKAKKGRV